MHMYICAMPYSLTCIYICQHQNFVVILLAFHCTSRTCRSWHDVKMYKMRARDSVLEIVGDDIVWKRIRVRSLLLQPEINFCEINAFLSILPLLKKKRKYIEYTFHRFGSLI